MPLCHTRRSLRSHLPILRTPLEALSCRITGSGTLSPAVAQYSTGSMVSARD
jgi:hypothetical protein